MTDSNLFGMAQWCGGDVRGSEVHFWREGRRHDAAVGMILVKQHNGFHIYDEEEFNRLFEMDTSVVEESR